MLRSFLIILCLIFLAFKVALTQNITTLHLKMFLRDGNVFDAAVKDRNAFVITEYATLNIRLAEIDSIVFGILPDFRTERRVINNLEQLYTGTLPNRIIAYNNLRTAEIRSLPIIRNFIDLSPYKITDLSDTLNAENLLSNLLRRHNLSRDFMDKDIVYLKQNFKIAGIFSVNKRRISLKFSDLRFSRVDALKLYISSNK